MRHRWRVEFEGKELTVNLDQLPQPNGGARFLEIKARTWSRNDAKQKATIVTQLLSLFEVDLNGAEQEEYPEIGTR